MRRLVVISPNSCLRSSANQVHLRPDLRLFPRTNTHFPEGGSILHDTGSFLLAGLRVSKSTLLLIRALALGGVPRGRAKAMTCQLLTTAIVDVEIP
jgi:hypothetical protein